MSNRRTIKSMLARFFGNPQEEYFSVETENTDLDKERRYFSRFLQSIAKNKEIGVSTEKGRNLLWFRRKKDK